MKIAAIQLVSSSDLQFNLQRAEHWIAKAVALGASLLVLPEEFAMFGRDDADRLRVKETYHQGVIQEFLSQQAKKHAITLCGGTLPIHLENSNKVRSACLVFDTNGQCISRYDKMHLFDAEVDDAKKIYCESKVVEPGDNVVVIDTPCGRLGLSICYDLRFPELYRALLAQGAEIILVPAAFAEVTGAHHWEILLRARAIENLAYVVAANQGGLHENGRRTYGNSMIVEPWGAIHDIHKKGEGLVMCNIDLAALHKIREKFPAISHRRL